MEEMLDVFDINGKHLGVKSRSFCHSENPGVYHKAVWIWIKNREGDILVQKRSMNKKKNPGKWDISVAGHVDVGETCIETCIRETQEELGVKCIEKDFNYVGQLINKRGWSLEQVYILVTDEKIENMILQNTEVEQVKYLNYSDFVKLLYSNEFVGHAKEFLDYFAKILE